MVPIALSKIRMRSRTDFSIETILDLVIEWWSDKVVK